MLTSLAFFLSASLSPPSLDAWSVSANNALIWGGRPYMPIGVRVDGTPEAIRKALDAGIQDLIVELPASGAGWDEALAVLNEKGARWFLAVSSAAPAALGTVVEPQGYRMDIEGKKDVDVHFPAAEQVLAVVADKRNSAIRSYRAYDTPQGVFKQQLDSQVLTPHVALFYPIVRDLRTPDFWEGFDGHRDALLQSLKTKKLGDGFRGIIDPMGSVARFPTPDIMFVPRSPIFEIEMESFLREKYGAIETCVKAWSIGAHDITAWEQLARLVPLWSETKGVESLWDPVKDRLYPSSRTNATVWTDIRTVIRSAATKRYTRFIQAIRQIVDVPVIQTWGGWTGPYDDPRTGLAGVGCEFTARSINDVIEEASRPASTVLQSTQGLVMMVTGLGLAKDARIDLETALDELKSIGSRGWFFHPVDDAQLALVAELAKKHREDASDAGWKPKPLFYPEGARDPAVPVKIFGGTWMLPSPAPGNRLDFGSSLKGYYYAGQPKPYTVIWATGDPVDTKLFLADPKAVKVEALDGSEVRIRERKDSIELEITQVPLIFSNIEDVPIPEIAYVETVLLTTALFGNFSLQIDPGGDQEFVFAQNVRAFKRNPIGGYSALVKHFETLLPRAAPYLWIEAERSPETNFGEPGFVPGASGGDCLEMDSKLSDAKGFYARYPLKPRVKGVHEIWLSADIPASVRDRVSLVVNGVVMHAPAMPVSYYGLGLAWYKFGSADLSESADVRIVVDASVDVPIQIDVLVASPTPFVPQGARMPTDFIGPNKK